MWQFTPTITHGGITFDDVLADSGRVTGIINWANCRVADPADDLLNFFGRVSPEVAADFMVAYSTHRPSNDHRLAHRARFASELEIARWLIHGTDTRDESIVAEAEGMLNTLLASVVDNPATDLGAPPKAPTTLVFGETQAAPPSVPHDPPADEPL
jgi:hypothetical protein